MKPFKENCDMNKEMRCREVKKLILRFPEENDEKVFHLVSEHLSECEACRSLYTASQRVAKGLCEEKRRLAEIVSGSQAGRSRILAEIAESRPAKRAWRLRPLWAGAAALLLLAMVGVSAILFTGRDGNGPDNVGSPMTTWSMAAAASSETVRELAEVLGRHEAPPLGLPYTPPPVPDEPLFPRLLQRCSRESQDTLKMIARSKTSLTRREGT